MCVSVCKCDKCSFFNYCINMDFESVNKDLFIYSSYAYYIILYIVVVMLLEMSIYNDNIQNYINRKSYNFSDVLTSLKL